MGYSGIKQKVGRDFNFFQKLAVNWTTFGGGAPDGIGPDIVIAWPTQAISFLNEATLSTQVVEYSFNGIVVHGELDPTLPSRGLTFDNRIVSLIWFRVKSGSSGPITVRIEAWANK